MWENQKNKKTGFDGFVRHRCLSLTTSGMIPF